MTAAGTDLTGLIGGWVNFDTAAAGIRLVDAAEDGGRLALSVAEDRPGGPRTRSALFATPLMDAGGEGPAVGFLAEGRLGPGDAVLCGYLNRGLLTIDVHTVTPGAPDVPPVMYRAHYYRPAPAQPAEPPEGAPSP
ncbi:hypothetical protein F7R91_36455 [Streptomyces luteolifulvus]|uniref:Uncharacterized protein n=1 Tax=Streptomyces luteolifulvus TaxID=2615112 RepID=A0A6H9UPG3_9ACTN|nr:hypothetical protein [Streptomyces luteolifulvus]KAB1140275.1 hypothetical protein F7R91_36455 [Streptomyces luteolifulvus]